MITVKFILTSHNSYMNCHPLDDGLLALYNNNNGNRKMIYAVMNTT